MDNTKIDTSSFKDIEAISQNGSIIQFFLFHGENYLGWDCFNKGNISVGRSAEADLVLEDPNVSDIQAIFSLEGDRVIVRDEGCGSGVYVNGEAKEICVLNPLDFVTIGSYTVKVKLKRIVGRVREVDAPSPDGPTGCEDTHSEPIEVNSREETETGETISEAVAIDEDIGKEKHIEKDHVGDGRYKLHTIEDDEDGEEEEDDDIDGPFSLREKFEEREHAGVPHTKGEMALEVVKFRADNVIDVRYLSNREKYYFIDSDGRFCIAENKNPKECYFYFNEQFNGKVRIDGSVSKDIASLCTKENLHHKRKRIYRDDLPEDGDVVLSDGYYEYILRRVICNQSPKVPKPPERKNPLYKNLMKSTGFHIILLVSLGLFISLPEQMETRRPESRFVEIDSRQLEKQIRPAPKPKPKPKLTKVRATKKSVKKALKKISGKSKRRAKVASRSPNAGGGSGKKGNILNRNVNQTGLLGLLGDSISIKPREALAVVTNLDAVSSMHSAKGNFKVGGIVGKLGSSKIEIPSAGLVNTQGSTQVLRSAGVKGKGMVAALEKGKTGQKQVMGMVKAKLTKRVRVQGGMSREAVKKVIDKHLDEISFCYESALVSNPSIMGKVIFEWKILLSGRVGEVKIKSSSINATEILSCIKEAIKSWQFPKPKSSEVIVSYPFIFDIVGF